MSVTFNKFDGKFKCESKEHTCLWLGVTVKERPEAN